MDARAACVLAARVRSEMTKFFYRPTCHHCQSVRQAVKMADPNVKMVNMDARDGGGLAAFWNVNVIPAIVLKNGTIFAGVKEVEEWIRTKEIKDGNQEQAGAEEVDTKYFLTFVSCDFEAIVTNLDVYVATRKPRQCIW